MTLSDRLYAGLQKLIVRAGVPIRIDYYSQTLGSVWDDEKTLATAGSVLTSGIVLPLDRTRGSWDSILLEQGKLQGQDQRLFTHGSLLFTGSDYFLKIGIQGENFTLIPNGVISNNTQGNQIYKKAYITRLTGSIR